MASPPETPEELVSISRELQTTDQAKYGFVWQGRQYEGLSCDFLEVLEGFGGQWLDPSTGEPRLDSNAAIASATWLYELINSGISPKAVTNFAEPESLQAFKAGDAAFMRNWPYAYAELQKPDSAVRGRVAVTTMVSQSGEQPTATLGSWGLSLLNDSPHKSSAVEAIRYLTSEAAQRERFLNQGYTPTSAVLFADPELVAVSPVLPDIGRALSVAVPRPPSPLYAQLSDVVQRSLSAVLTGEQSAEQGMKAAQSNSEVILQSAGGQA
jgi:multiple sugar transport system substrate-binding protein